MRSRENPVASFSQRKLEPRATARPSATWCGTSGDPAPGSRSLRLFAGTVYLQLWSLTMGTLSAWSCPALVLPCDGKFMFCWQQMKQVLLEPADWDFLYQQCSRPWEYY